MIERVARAFQVFVSDSRRFGTMPAASLRIRFEPAGIGLFRGEGSFPGVRRRRHGETELVSIIASERER
jgi:hypothetical protein